MWAAKIPPYYFLRPLLTDLAFLQFKELLIAEFSAQIR